MRGDDGHNEGGTVATTTELAPDAEPIEAKAFDLSMPARVVLASLSAAAGAIHLVMAPIHASTSSIDAFAFAGAGWYQLVYAGIIKARPNKACLQVAVVDNIVFFAAWNVSRTNGLP